MANVQDVAKFFIELAQKQDQQQAGDLMTNLRLQKLLYFAQGWHLAKYNQPLFSAPIMAWKYGPVVPEVYYTYQINGSCGIQLSENHAAYPFSDVEMDLLLDVLREYGEFSTNALVGLTHQPNTPWARTPQSTPIDVNLIKDYFEAQPPMRSFEDILSALGTYTPGRDDKGVAVLPADFSDDWGDVDAD